MILPHRNEYSILNCIQHTKNHCLSRDIRFKTTGKMFPGNRPPGPISALSAPWLPSFRGKKKTAPDKIAFAAFLGIAFLLFSRFIT